MTDDQPKPIDLAFVQAMLPEGFTVARYADFSPFPGKLFIRTWRDSTALYLSPNGTLKPGEVGNGDPGFWPTLEDLAIDLDWMKEHGCFEKLESVK